MRRRFPGVRRFVFFLGDMAIVLASSCAAVFVVVWYSGVEIDVQLYQRMLPVMLIVVGGLILFDGLLSLTRKQYSEVFLDLLVLVFKMYVAMMALSFFLRDFSYSRSILLVAGVFQFILLAIWKRICWNKEQRDMLPRRVMVMGAENDFHVLVNRLRVHSYLKDQVKYVCTSYESGAWRQVIHDVDLVILASDLPLQHKAAMLHYCQINNRQLFIIPDFYEVYCSNVDLDQIDDIPVYRPRYLRPTVEQRVLKRILDLTVAGIAVVCLAPVFLAVAIAIKIDSKGPVFFYQSRVGELEKEFDVFKFRTMCVDAEAMTGPTLATTNDPRITRLGRFLRATRLDEIPQLVNVIFGDMSIVGPRPERAFFIEMLKRELPEYVHRSNVKPGITGMAQVYGKYSTTPYNKLVYDLIYIQNFSVINDLILMLKTFRILLTRSSTQGIGSGYRDGLEEVEILRGRRAP